MNNWKRARSEEQKEERSAVIVHAAARLFDRLPAEEITLTLIAKEAGFTRSNIYKYFEAKEDILMELLKTDVAAYRRGLYAHFENLRDPSVEEFVAEWVRVQKMYPRFLRLTSILHSFLESNASMESLISFKQQVLEEYNHFTRLLSRLFPQLSSEKAIKFFNLQAAVSAGLYQVANQTETQKQVLSMPEFQSLKQHPEALYRQAVEYILRGILAEEQD